VVVKLAIVGSTLLNGPRSRAIILDAIQRHGATCIVSGGAKGIDSLAETIADELGLAKDIRAPEVQRWEDKVVSAPLPLKGVVRKGFKTRNLEIASRCDALVRIGLADADQMRLKGRITYGSGFTRDRARDLGKPTEEFILTIEEDRHG
jgi:hypothetical protein